MVNLMGSEVTTEISARPRAMLLKPGLLVRDEDDNILDARSSSTLILAGPWRIVVDTGAEDEADEITKRLGEFGLVPEDVEMAVI
ncbi:MAG: MBL fold metallo-hydrolase, partial [Methanothrix sp.]|nr:MBL fold metallo-hydrolase [Methanothrix sp.]